MIDESGKIKMKRNGYEYEVGDMVWGKVRSHPWWPGHIYSEDFALPSVRKSKREGHVLVAFFGDSTYGWFDPINIIPFDINYSEKSKQTKAKDFVNAVKEAEDEIRRRVALGLACRCRNPSNFRATSVKGFVEVDVCGYHPSEVYSAKQIESARDGFWPVEMLSFVQKLASMPCSNSRRVGVNWIKNVAVVLAYRKAVFEEVNQTYFQAFGVQPKCGASLIEALDLPEQVPSQASLDGPLTQERSKNSPRPLQIKVQHKIGKYVLEQTKESDISQVHHAGQGKQSFSSPLKYEKAVVSAPDHGMQSHYTITEFPGQENAIHTNGSRSPTLHPDQHKIGKYVVEQTKEPDISQVHHVGQGKQSFVSPLKYEKAALSAPDHVVQSHHTVTEFPDLENAIHTNGSRSTTLHPDHSGNKPTTVKKKSVLKKISSVKAVVKRGPSRVKSCDKSQGSQQFQPRLAKPVKISHCSEDVLAVGRTSPPSDAVSHEKVLVTSSDRLEKKPRVLKGLGEDLHSEEACMTERKKSKKKHKFESGLEYPQNHIKREKLGSENGTPNTMSSDFLANEPMVETPNNGTAQDLPSALEPPKKQLKPGDCAKSGLNGSISDCGIKVPMEELKKLNVKKALTADTKAGNRKLVKSVGRIEREMSEAVSTKQKIYSPKKHDSQTRATEHTMIVMKFPRQSALPSISELKARFARFGQLRSTPSLLWKFSTCQVVFKYESDAKAAYGYAVGNRSLFGNVKVDYCLQASEVPTKKFPKPGKQLVGKTSDDIPPVKSMSSGYSVKPKSMAPQRQLLHPSVQPKSCLKKQLSDEKVESTVVAPSDNQHVNLMLSGKETSGAEQLQVNSININAKNFPKVIPLLPPPLNWDSYMHEKRKVEHFVEVQNIHHLQLEASNSRVYTTSTQSMDISNQMINLLTGCNEIITNLNCSLGYVPYNI